MPHWHSYICAGKLDKIYLAFCGVIGLQNYIKKQWNIFSLHMCTGLILIHYFNSILFLYGIVNVVIIDSLPLTSVLPKFIHIF